MYDVICGTYLLQYRRCLVPTETTQTDSQYTNTTDIGDPICS